MKSSRKVVVCLTTLVLLSCLVGTALAGSPAPAQLQTRAPSATQTATEAQERSEAYGQLQSLAEELKLGTLGIFSGGDANGDGSVTVADVFYLINFLFASGAAPAQGSTVTWKGPWVNTTTYDLHDAVSFDGSSWVSRIASNTGNPPSTSPAQWDLLAAKGEAGTSFTGAAAGGDLSGTYPNPAVATVGGVSAANIASGAAAANAASSANTPNTIVRRDAGGNFSAGTITAALSGNATTATSATNFSGSLAGEVTGTQGATVVSNAVSTNTANTVVRRDGSAGFSAGTVALSGNLTLPASSSTAGTLLQGSSRLLHTFGIGNVFVGLDAGNFTMNGFNNTAIGASALQSNTLGSSNTATGSNALSGNTTGGNNTASGFWALLGNSEGNNNTASGFFALRNNTTGSENTAIGAAALSSNSASGNTASGAFALQSNTIGSENTANGGSALFSNTAGSHNTASGSQALRNTTGDNNTANGSLALFNNTSGSSNTAIGVQALSNITGSFNIGVGSRAGENLTTGDSNIDIANFGVAGDVGTIRIGSGGTHTRAFLAGVRGVTTGMANGLTVLIDSNGQLGTINSSASVKRDIAGMGEQSAAVMKLRPVSFFYRSDAVGIRQYGLMAEEVAEVMPELVQFSPKGEAETVRYHFLPPLLLNEIQKQQQTIEEQRKQITMLEARLTALEEQSRHRKAKDEIVK